MKLNPDVIRLMIDEKEKKIKQKTYRTLLRAGYKYKSLSEAEKDPLFIKKYSARKKKNKGYKLILEHDEKNNDFLKQYKNAEKKIENKKRKAEIENLLESEPDVFWLAFDIDKETKNAIKDIKNRLRTNKTIRWGETELSIDSEYFNKNEASERDDKFLKEDNIYVFLSSLKEYIKYSLKFLFEDRIEDMVDKLASLSPKIKEIKDRACGENALKTQLGKYIIVFRDKVVENVDKQISKEVAIELLRKNKYHKEAIENYLRVVEGLVTVMPKEYKDLFPLAREIKRHFILHVGPTNSGKTYEAVEAMKKSNSGVYLGPLRLLAYEQYEKLNMDGYICDLITGEEIRKYPFAKYQASTIEMLSETEKYDVAVIDECQMVGNKYRGGAWTSAILGVCAKEIHCCLAPEGKDILIRLIEECGDTYEIIEHKRKAEIKADNDSFSFPKDVCKHDALIVFSRARVHAVAAELKDRRGMKVSTIYGNLPYDVRHEEARKFAEGETDVLVATDAIGMGLNLPIKRVVLMQNYKFDGRGVRPLRAEEIQQIAGRAGRFGKFDVGYYTAESDKKWVENMYNSKVKPVEKAYLGFPRSLLGIDAKLSSILKQWASMDANNNYSKGSFKTMIEQCEFVESLTDDKNIAYDLITIPFDDRNVSCNKLWKSIVKSEANGDFYDFNLATIKIPKNMTINNLEKLETYYRMLDLLYMYDMKFNYGNKSNDILSVKNQIAEKIIKILEKQKFAKNKCQRCGKILPWDYKYRICESCFRRGMWWAH